MAAHDPRLWETLQDFSQNLAIWTSRRNALSANRELEMVLLCSKTLDFALTKAGKDSSFKLTKEQKSIIEAVVSQKKKKECAKGSTNRLRQVIGFAFVK